MNLRIEIDKFVKGMSQKVEIFSALSVDRKERMIQVYIVVFGLLLSYRGSDVLQTQLMSDFVIFLMSALIYYSLLPHCYNGFRFTFFIMNTLFVAYYFSHSIILCMVDLNLLSWSTMAINVESILLFGLTFSSLVI